MSVHTRTTVRLDDTLLEQARREAERRGQTLTSLIELGLRLAIAQSNTSNSRPRVVLPVSRIGGGARPGIDINNSAQLSDILDGVE